MKRAANIAKGIIGKLPLQKQMKPFESVSWRNEKILKHQEDEREKEAILSGYCIKYKRPYELLHTYVELFEKQIYKFQTNSVNPLIIDCGSNIGLSVLYFKQLYPNSVIIAFEPDSGNFSLLKNNVESNGLKKVELNRAAVWINDGEISFDANESEASHVSEEGSSKKVRSVSLNKLMGKYNEIDFLKIDIEGAENKVIPDCENQLTKVKNLFLEYHGKVEETPKLEELLNILNIAGFKVYIANAADHLKKPFVEKRTETMYDVQLNLFCYR